MGNIWGFGWRVIITLIERLVLSEIHKWKQKTEKYASQGIWHQHCRFPSCNGKVCTVREHRHMGQNSPTINS